MFSPRPLGRAVAAVRGKPALSRKSVAVSAVVFASPLEAVPSFAEDHQAMPEAGRKRPVEENSRDGASADAKKSKRLRKSVIGDDGAAVLLSKTDLLVDVARKGPGRKVAGAEPATLPEDVEKPVGKRGLGRPRKHPKVESVRSRSVFAAASWRGLEPSEKGELIIDFSAASQPPTVKRRRGHLRNPGVLDEGSVDEMQAAGRSRSRLADAAQTAKAAENGLITLGGRTWQSYQAVDEAARSKSQSGPGGVGTAPIGGGVDVTDSSSRVDEIEAGPLPKSIIPNLAVTGEPVVKRPRGRPRKHPIVKADNAKELVAKTPRGRSQIKSSNFAMLDGVRKPEVPITPGETPQAGVAVQPEDAVKPPLAEELVDNGPGSRPRKVVVEPENKVVVKPHGEHPVVDDAQTPIAAARVASGDPEPVASAAGMNGSFSGSNAGKLYASFSPERFSRPSRTSGLSRDNTLSEARVTAIVVGGELMSEGVVSDGDNVDDVTQRAPSEGRDEDPVSAQADELPIRHGAWIPASPAGWRKTDFVSREEYVGDETGDVEGKRMASQEPMAAVGFAGAERCRAGGGFAEVMRPLWQPPHYVMLHILCNFPMRFALVITDRVIDVKGRSGKRCSHVQNISSQLPPRSITSRQAANSLRPKHKRPLYIAMTKAKRFTGMTDADFTRWLDDEYADTLGHAGLRYVLDQPDPAFTGQIDWRPRGIPENPPPGTPLPAGFDPIPAHWETTEETYIRIEMET
ncbi:hypothetical protein HK101_010777 [Irineochytrium annulatum]|nr:hypothetical protein HK101_010777 [Irineochytrium annulatum]